MPVGCVLLVFVQTLFRLFFEGKKWVQELLFLLAGKK
jgi:hypothetical protein